MTNDRTSIAFIDPATHKVTETKDVASLCDVEISHNGVVTAYVYAPSTFSKQ